MTTMQSKHIDQAKKTMQNRACNKKESRQKVLLKAVQKATIEVAKTYKYEISEHDEKYESSFDIDQQINNKIIEWNGPQQQSQSRPKSNNNNSKSKKKRKQKVKTELEKVIDNGKNWFDRHEAKIFAEYWYAKHLRAGRKYLDEFCTKIGGNINMEYVYTVFWYYLLNAKVKLTKTEQPLITAKSFIHEAVLKQIEIIGGEFHAEIEDLKRPNRLNKKGKKMTSSDIMAGFKKFIDDKMRNYRDNEDEDPVQEDTESQNETDDTSQASNEIEEVYSKHDLQKLSQSQLMDIIISSQKSQNVNDQFKSTESTKMKDDETTDITKWFEKKILEIDGMLKLKDKDADSLWTVRDVIKSQIKIANKRKRLRDEDDEIEGDYHYVSNPLKKRKLSPQYEQDTYNYNESTDNDISSTSSVGFPASQPSLQPQSPIYDHQQYATNNVPDSHSIVFKQTLTIPINSFPAPQPQIYTNTNAHTHTNTINNYVNPHNNGNRMEYYHTPNNMNYSRTHIQNRGYSFQQQQQYRVGPSIPSLPPITNDTYPIFDGQGHTNLSNGNYNGISKNFNDEHDINDFY